MTLASMVPMILLMLMGRRAAPPPPWPGERRPQPHGRTRPARPQPRPKTPQRGGTLPGFISPDHPLLTAMPVGPGVPIRTRPTPRNRPRPDRSPIKDGLDRLPIRSPGLPTTPDLGPPPGVPDSVLHPPPPHFDLPDIPADIEVPPEVRIEPIETVPDIDRMPEPEPEDEPEKVVVVRKGEGLSQVAQRLGRPGGLPDVRALRAANIPHGPEHDWESTSTGNLTIPGQPKRGLQPGDVLFVPQDWL